MKVFAFDRDETVDVNPHPDPEKEPVPLAWVRHLTHHTEHAVYAHGHQALTLEAEVPGLRRAKERANDIEADSHWSEVLGVDIESRSYAEGLTRRERVRLVECVHPDAEEYVVVDDVDLSDLDGWQHYHSWEFVAAVREGKRTFDLPERFRAHA
jgi:hypothetical protein